MQNQNAKAAQRQAVEHLRQAYARWKEGTATPDDLNAVEADLRRFCRAGVSTFHPDPRVHAMLEGRREVFLRIEQFSTLTTEEIIEARKLETSPQ
jgi:hypothetical protein